MKRLFSVLLAASILLGGVMLVGPAESGDVMPQINALTPHAPIRINNNTDFATLGFNGTGTAGNPWIIENYEIDGTGHGYCIYVGNTTEHFVVKNSYLHNASGGPGSIYYFDSSVMMFNVSHGELFNNTVAFSNYGIYFYNDSFNNTILNNTVCYNTNTGVLLDAGSHGNEISDNIIYSNGLHGIYIYKGDGNILRRDTVSHNGNSGIFIYTSAVNWILNCTADNNTAMGIHIYSSSEGNLVTQSSLVDNGCGVRIYNSAHNTIYNNDFINNTIQAYDNNASNNWDSAAWDYMVGGNYWNDYAGQDIMSGPAQNLPGADGFGDTPYTNIGGGALAQDRYPLMQKTTTEPILDSTPPYALSFTPNSTAEPTDVPIVITWSETMNWTSVMEAFEYTDGTTSWTSANGTWAHAGNVSTFTPTPPFAYETHYVVTVNSSAADPAGNMLDQNMNGTGGEWPADVLTWNFTTAILDADPPFALNYTPNGTTEPADVPITITWSETMDWASVEAAFEYTDGTTNWTSANGTWTHLGNDSTFTPTLPLAYETHYVVTVNSSAADMVGNMLDQNRNGTGGEWPADILTWSFTTIDEAPYVVSTQPADGQIGVDPHKPFKIIFSERMNRTGVEQAFTFTDGVDDWNITNGVGYWNALFTEFTFSPDTVLELNTTFQAYLNGTLARDLGGKGLKFGDYSWQFTTWLQPPAPQITSTYPPDGAFNVNVNTYINIAFDNEMDTASVEGAFSYTDGANIWRIADGTVDWFSENTLFSFQPTVALDFESEYRVKISSAARSIYGVGLDGNGNGIPEPNDNYTFMFTTTVEPPKVVSYYPGSRQMDLPTDLAAVYINFSKVMNLPSVTSAIAISPNIPFVTAFSGGGRNLTIVLTGTLLEGTEYRVTVLGTAMDIGGTKLDGNGDGWPGDRFSTNFFTKGVIVPVKPTITAIFPLNNATIPVDSFYVAVTFSVPMNRTSVESAFSFKNTSATINGTIQWSSTNRSFRFTPAETLAYNTTYTVHLAGTAKSMEGLAMVNASSWQYLTEPMEEAPPMMDWILYGVILMLLGLTIVLYMANRSLRRDLKRTRVKLKRLKREMGIKDDVPENPDEVEKSAVQPEEEFPEKVMPEPDIVEK